MKVDSTKHHRHALVSLIAHQYTMHNGVIKHSHIASPAFL